MIYIYFGGVCINDMFNYVVVEDMFFGGVGFFGMGYYYGYEGFLMFSKVKSVLIKGKFSVIKMLFLFWNCCIYCFLLNVVMKNLNS